MPSNIATLDGAFLPFESGRLPAQVACVLSTAPAFPGPRIAPGNDLRLAAAYGIAIERAIVQFHCAFATAFEICRHGDGDEYAHAFGTPFAGAVLDRYRRSGVAIGSEGDDCARLEQAVLLRIIAADRFFLGLTDSFFEADSGETHALFACWSSMALATLAFAVRTLAFETSDLWSEMATLRADESPDHAGPPPAFAYRGLDFTCEVASSVPTRDVDRIFRKLGRQGGLLLPGRGGDASEGSSEVTFTAPFHELAGLVNEMISFGLRIGRIRAHMPF